MFADWSACLASIELDRAPERQVRAWLSAAAQHQSALEGFIARCAVRLGEASAVRGATRCTQREADRTLTRGSLLDAMPEVGAALEAGAISGAHVDALAKAAERSSIDAVAAGPLLDLAHTKPADTMRKQIGDFVREHGSEADLQRRRERQRKNRRAFLTVGDDGMGVLHAEFDDSVFARLKAAVDAEADRLYRLDGGRKRDAAARTPQQRRAERYDLKLWIGDLFEGATYLPR